MKPLGDIREHFWLTLGMAKHCDVDLGDALREGRISHSEYADHISRCRACPAPDHCKDWLAHTEAGAEPPHYCQNLESFAAIKRAAT